MGWIILNHTVDGNPNHQLMVYINPTMNICFQPSLKLVFFLGEIAGPSHMAHPQVLGAHPQVLQKKHGQHVKTAWWFGTFGFFPYLFHSVGNVMIPTDSYFSERVAGSRWLNHQPVIHVCLEHIPVCTKLWQRGVAYQFSVSMAPEPPYIHVT